MEIFTTFSPLYFKQLGCQDVFLGQLVPRGIPAGQRAVNPEARQISRRLRLEMRKPNGETQYYRMRNTTCLCCAKVHSLERAPNHHRRVPVIAEFTN
jgi:hypothetical protein